MIPEDLRYTAEHEWVTPVKDGRVRMGITDFAQDSLGDIVYVQMPELGTVVEAGAPLGELESTKSVSELYAPVSGSVRARNDQLVEAPDLINTEPYTAGWIVEIEPADPEAVNALLDAAGYRELTER